MKIENLKVGMILNNYKALCEILVIKPKTGASKLSQLKEFNRFFIHHRDGNKYIIDDIFELPLPKLNKLDSTIYGKEIDALILDLLAKNLKINKRTIVIGKQKLLTEFAMINANYFYGLRNKETFSEILDIDIKYIDDFYNISYAKLKSTLESSFKRLSLKSLITWKEVICIVSSNGQKVANDKQERLITSMEIMAMSELNCKHRGEVVLKKQWDVFNQNVNNKIINKEYLNISEFSNLNSMDDFRFYYRAYKLNYNDFILKELDNVNNFLLQYNNRIKTKYELNQKLIVNYKKSNQKRHTKNKEQCEEQLGEVTSPNMELKIRNDYVKNSDLLVDKCIKVEFI